MKPIEIKQMRSNMKLTQQDLAYMLDTTPVTVSRWERGETKPSKIYVKMMLKMNK